MFYNIYPNYMYSFDHIVVFQEKQMTIDKYRNI